MIVEHKELKSLEVQYRRITSKTQDRVTRTIQAEYHKQGRRWYDV